MSKTMKKHSTSMEDQGSGKGKKEDYFDRIDYEVSSILLDLSHPVVFSSCSPLFHKWGRTKKRSSSFPLHLPVNKTVSCMEVGDMVSNSSSSCLTGEAKKTSPQISSSQPNTTCSILEAEMGLLRTQVGLITQPIRDGHHHIQPLISVDRTVNVRERRGFDLNLPAAEECNRVVTMVGFERVASKVQAAAQARQRRLGLIRSKKLYTRFFSSYQFK